MTLVEVIGRYQLVERVGEGGMGIVYKAEHLDLRRTVALKVLRTDWTAKEDAVERFYREARAAARVHHPNVVAIHDVGCDGERHYIAMEFIEGKPLSKVIGTGMAPRAVAQLVERVARAMNVCHEAGVIHRDLKPANILVDAAGAPHVTDFGLAKAVGAAAGITGSGWTVGTPCYMPPEQVRGETVDARSDQYAIGVILYEALTGRPPFTAQDVGALFNKIIVQAPPRPRPANGRLHADLETIVLKALAKERDRRYPTTAAMADDLRRFLDGEPILARPTAWYTQLALRVRRHPAMSAAGAAAIIIAMAGLLFGVMQRVAREGERSGRAERVAHLRSLAERERGRGDWMRAKEFYDQILALSPDDATARRGAEECAAKFADAAKELAAARETEKRRAAARRRLDAVRQLLEDADRDFMGALADPAPTWARVDRAVDEIRAVLGVDDLIAEAHYHQARAERLRGRYEEADAALARATEIDPTYAAARLLRGLVALDRYALEIGFSLRKPEVRMKLGAPHAERAALEIARALEGRGGLREKEELLARIGVEFARGDIARAERLAREAAARHDTVEFHRALGDILFATKRKPEAEKCYDRALELRRGAWEILHLRALARMGEEMAPASNATALADVDRAIALNPSFGPLHATRGHVLYYLGRQRESLEAMERARELEFAPPELTMLRANLRRAMGDLAGAIAEYGAYLKERPDDCLAYNNRGFARLQRHEAREAIADFDEAIRLMPGFYHAWRGRAQAKLEAGDERGALSDFLRAYEMRPAQSADLKEVIAELRRRLED